MPLCLALALPCAVALAQAPVEERGVTGNSFLEAQQRVEFARRAADQAYSALRDAERDLRQADSAVESARRQLDEARTQAERSKKGLAQARAKAAESRAVYERESAQFGRIRRGAQ